MGIYQGAAEVKHLLFCLLIGSFVFPAWSQEKEMTLDEFIDKVGNAKPWTLEKLEAELGIKFEQISLSEIYSGYAAYEKPPSAKNLPIEGILLDILRATNKTHELTVDIDTDSVCLRREHLEAMYPKGFLDVSHAQPGGGAAYYDARAWGVAVFGFARDSKKGECVTDISFREDRQVKEYNEDILKYIRWQE